MISKLKLVIIAITYLGAGPALYAAVEAIEIGGSARVRSEHKKNADFEDAAGDSTNSTGSRFRLDLKIKINDQIGLYLQPQFSKVWGEPEMVPTSTTSNASSNTSGALNDTGLDIHQAYLHYLFSEPLFFLFGRKELNYGDQLLVGGVGWSHIGRSFDLIQATFKYEIGTAEIFNAKVVDRNVGAAGAGDKNFSGLYFNNKISEQIQNADVYVFHSGDSSTDPATRTTAYGLRMKSPVSAFDYRVEVTFENVKTATVDSDEHQYDLELGYVLHESTRTRIAVEYFSATENFDSLYPTGHKWLGYADFFARRNIQGYRAGLSHQWSERWTLNLDYHQFEREDTDSPAYKFSGAAYATTGTDRDLASELDLVIAYKFNGGLNLEGGIARVFPGEELKATVGRDEGRFHYLQASTAF